MDIVLIFKALDNTPISGDLKTYVIIFYILDCSRLHTV